MQREDWEKLDRLLGLEGFGGYYGTVEWGCVDFCVLKMVW